MSQILGTNIASWIVPFDTADTFPTHDPIYGIGGWREVPNYAALTAIPAPRLREGMVVHVSGDKPYQYIGGAWVSLASQMVAEVTAGTYDAFGAAAAAQTAAELAATNALTVAVGTLNTAKTAAQADDERSDAAALSTAQTTLNSAILAAITTAENFATSADAANLTAANSYSDTALSAAVATLGTAITNAISTAESAATTALGIETARALAAEGTLGTSISTETTRAEAAEAALGTSISTLTTTVTTTGGSVTAETTRAEAAEVLLTGNLASEVTRATGVEATLTTGLAAEVSRATAAEATLTTNVTTVTTGLTTETSRAEAAEVLLTGSLAAEVTRAELAEGLNTSQLLTEVTRAEAVEATLTSGAATEVTNRIAGDAATLTAAETFATGAVTTAALTVNTVTAAAIAAAQQAATYTLPAPTVTTLGGVEAVSEVPSNWISSITNAGVPTLARPAASDITFDNGTYATVEAALNALFYVPVTASISNNINTVETGTAVTSVVLTWIINGSKPLTSQTIGGVAVTPLTLRTETISIPAGLNNVNTSYTLSATDGQTTATPSTSVAFLPKVYYGPSANATLTNAQILGLTGSTLAGSKGRTMTFNCTGGAYPYYCYPSSFGAPTTVTVGGLQFSDYTVNTQSVTNAQGYVQNYNVIKFNSLQNGANINVVWS